MNEARRLQLTTRLTLIAFMISFTVICMAQFGGGLGTEESPWAIETAEHLNNVRQYLGAQHNDKFFILRANIDLGVAPWNEGQGWVTMGTNVASAFYGNLNGNGYVIRNLTINRPTTNYQALFGYISGTSVIKDLGLVDVNIIGNNYVGAYVGYIDDSGKIERCYVTGRVQGTNYVGGMVGRNGSNTNQSSFILDCYSSAHVIATGGTPTTYAGGITAYQYRGQTSRCYATGLVELTVPSSNAGAVMGRRGGGTHTHLYWNIETTGQEEGVGNLIGQFPGSTTTQLLEPNTYGNFDFDNVWNIAVGESYAYLRWQGDEPGEHNFPGLIPPGNLDFTAGDGFVNITWEAPPEELGVPNGYNVYRDGDRINVQLVQALQYRDEAVNNWVTYSYYLTAVYDGEESGPSASIRATPVNFAGGTGTAEDPFQIATAQHLNGIRYALGAHYRQTANINLGEAPWNEGQGWVPIADNNNHFTGNYNGNGFIIDQLTINRNSPYQSLFGYANGAVINGVRLRNVEMTGSHFTAALVAYAANSTISNCYVRGNVNGTYYMGGIVGFATGTTISGCYVTGAVVVPGTSTTGYIGGIVGYFTGNSNLTNCYSNAMVQGNQQRIGGLVGWINSAINNSYNTGAVIAINETANVGGLVGQHSGGVVSNSFWNTETTGRETSPGGGTGIGTTQMVRRGTFDEAGWEFPDIWNIVEGETYPYLAWENGPSFHNRPGPSGLVATGDYEELEIDLEWDMIGAPARYNIYRNNVRVTSVNHPTREWLDTDVQLFVEYMYYVEAIFIEDEQELVSAPSNSVNVILTPPFAGGDGSQNSPYQVANEGHLNIVRYIPNAYFIQTADLDLHREAWTPIGNNDIRFRGNYNGNNFIISSLNMNTNVRYAGLFGYTEAATLSNITLVDVDITVGMDGGALVGRAQTTTINNCSSHGVVNGTGQGVGGLLGYMSSGVMNDSHSTATINAPNAHRIGGLVGDSWGNINRSWATGDVTGGNRVGGLCGNDYNGTHNQNYATGRVTGNNEVGGLYGLIQTATYNDMYATGDVVGNDMVGGLVGHSAHTGRMYRAYSIGRVTGNTNVGGLIGFINPNNPGPTEASYWNTETSGQDESPGGGLPRDSRHMTFPYTEDTYVGWNFNTTWNDDVDPSWNNGYPRLHYQVQPPAEHLDTPEVRVDIVRIDNANHFRLSWELVEDALSYRIYASDNPYSDNWGDPIRVVGEDVTSYTEAIGENTSKYFYIIASSREAR